MLDESKVVAEAEPEEKEVTVLISATRSQAVECEAKIPEELFKRFQAAKGADRYRVAWEVADYIDDWVTDNGDWEDLGVDLVEKPSDENSDDNSEED